VLAPAAEAKKWFAGVVPDVPSGGQVHAPARARTANVIYHGGSVLHHNRAHLIFWQPTGSGLHFDAGYVALVKRFLGDVAADSRRTTNVYSLSGQYHDHHGPAAYASSYGGAVIDTHPLPRNGCVEPPTAPLWTHCMSDEEMVAEIDRVVSAHKLPQTRSDIYFLLTPNGLGSCEGVGPNDCALGGDASGSYCGYHSVSSDGLLYAIIPYNAVPPHCQSGNPRPNSSPADPSISTLSHEHNETVTDPLGDAWFDDSGEEIADICIQSYGPALGGSAGTAFNQVIHGHRYYLQEEWSNHTASCKQRAGADHVSFHAPQRGKARASVRFSAQASSPGSSIKAYDWFFGDRGRGHGRRVKHTFKRSGSYRVVLRVTDGNGNWGFSARRIRIHR
jgi:hypothetical protein